MVDAVVVTGSAGFLGRWVCRALAGDYHVVGADRLSNLSEEPSEYHVVGDSPGSLGRLLCSVAPSLVVHSAFVNRKPAEWSDGEYLCRMLSMDYEVLTAAQSVCARVIVISSSAVYGEGEGTVEITEATPLRPVSLYGAAKRMQESIGEYFRARGLSVTVLRLFNLIGPGQPDGLLLADWIRQARLAIQGAGTHITARHRCTIRDFVDVRDAARAVALACTSTAVNDVFNVASGEGVSLLRLSEELCRLSPFPLHFVDSERTMTAADVRSQRGSYQKLNTAVGWCPEIPWKQSLRDAWVAAGLPVVD